MLDKAFVNAEVAVVERYKKLFNTAHAVAEHICPFFDFQFLCSVQEKNGVNLGNDRRGRDACAEIFKSISAVLLNDVSYHLNTVRFFSVVSDSSTASSVIDQEWILPRYVHTDSPEPYTTMASIESLESATADGIVSAVKCGLSNVT